MNACRKGADAERELARVLSALFGCEVKRLASPYLPGIVAPDVYGLPGVHVEVKRRERVALPAALRQAKHDARERVAIVAHRGNGHPWLATVELSDLPALAAALAGCASARHEAPSSPAGCTGAGPPP